MDKLTPMGEHFGQWLRAHRESAGLSTRALGDAAGISHNAVALFETGRKMPLPETLAKIAAALGIDQDDATLATFPDRFDENDRRLLRRWLQP